VVGHRFLNDRDCRIGHPDLGALEIARRTVSPPVSLAQQAGRQAGLTANRAFDWRSWVGLADLQMSRTKLDRPRVSPDKRTGIPQVTSWSETPLFCGDLNPILIRKWTNEDPNCSKPSDH